MPEHAAGDEWVEGRCRAIERDIEQRRPFEHEISRSRARLFGPSTDEISRWHAHAMFDSARIGRAHPEPAGELNLCQPSADPLAPQSFADGHGAGHAPSRMVSRVSSIMDR